MFRFNFFAACYTFFSYFVLMLAVLPAIASSQTPPELQLANRYHPKINVQNYWVSEKLDGVRAYWNGTQFISKQGHIYNAPEWFIQNFPSFHLDGELWLARSAFDELSGIVRKKKPIDDEWRKVTYQVFDLPLNPASFDVRLNALKTLFGQAEKDEVKWPLWLKLIPQFKLQNHQKLKNELDKVVIQGGEGLMLHLGTSLYHGKRDDDLLKLKPYFDAEARVMEYFLGKGKYKNMLGSMLVEMLDTKKRFRIGTGFSDKQRQEPPEVGSIITYKYFGLTSKGLPKFASFIRVRGE